MEVILKKQKKERINVFGRNSSGKVWYMIRLLLLILNLSHFGRGSYISLRRCLHEINYKIVRVNHFYLYCEIWIFSLCHFSSELRDSSPWERRIHTAFLWWEKEILAKVRDDEFCFMTLSLWYHWQNIRYQLHRTSKVSTRLHFKGIFPNFSSIWCRQQKRREKINSFKDSKWFWWWESSTHSVDGGIRTLAEYM